MYFSNKFRTFILLLLVGFGGNTRACSMYKTSIGEKTMVGTNADTWRTTPHIWFEVAKNGSHGCCFTGSRQIGKDRYAAQSGMNEHGLSFARLSSYHPRKRNAKNLKLIENPDQFLMAILKSCKNIDEVCAMLKQYDRSCFLGDVFVYVEPSGNYLVVEPYKLTRGSDPSYVLANFCPSITQEKDRRNQKRYATGRDLLNKKIDTSLAFCSHLSDEMRVCREKIGDGTLLTNIWNTQDKKLTLYFYHDFSNAASFDLQGELAKGDHQLAIASLFPKNEEFEQLKQYVTPFNTPWLRIALVLGGFFFLISSLYFLGSAFKSTQRKSSKSIRFVFSLILLSAGAYAFVLATTKEVFYFPAPYTTGSVWSSLASYLPFFISGLVMVILLLIWKKRSTNSWNWFSNGLIFLNAIALSGLYVGFFYWELF